MVIGDMCAFIYIQDITHVPACLQELRRLTDPHSGEPVFSGVWTFEEAYGRICEEAYRHFIVALPQEGFSVSTGFRQAVVRLCTRAGDYPGIHRPEGIFVASGPDIRCGIQSHLDLVDMAPTLLYLLGLPIPADMDGRVASSILTLDREPKIVPVLNEDFTTGRQEFSEKEEALIQERLRSLGYLQ
jgi:predicted AlkP superfamily phosphohydrolase/phosphomutase